MFIPSGHFIKRADDKLSFIASRKNARTILASVGFQTHQVKSTMIVGGGRVAYYLAKQLLNMGIDVKIIENDKERALKLSEELSGAVIINGDGTDESLLREEGIEYVESFVPLTGIDEENVMLTLYARKVSEETLGKYFPNTPMLAAIVKVTGIMSDEAFLEDMKGSFKHKFAKKPEVIEGNMKALELALKEVTKIQ